MHADNIEAMLTAMPAPLGPWQSCTERADWVGVTRAANSIVEMADGAAIFPEGKDVPVTFRQDLLIRHLGTATGSQGDLFHGVLFTLPGCLEVIAWVADDEDGLERVRWRGDQVPLGKLAYDLFWFSDTLAAQ